ncbi:hypothetical protein HPB50_012791 [Hyalomma asiaticum]|uniref:Uncharacterized protein n=1 Tax=Hyalomma asiaticum TaxID=266040 RepID=A0ACB7SPS5_HYAAI|nr:hypothetical protein HPB50_012791 [Hyalomma asiaticum]
MHRPTKRELKRISGGGGGRFQNTDSHTAPIPRHKHAHTETRAHTPKRPRRPGVHTGCASDRPKRFPPVLGQPSRRGGEEQQCSHAAGPCRTCKPARDTVERWVPLARSLAGRRRARVRAKASSRSQKRRRGGPLFFFSLFGTPGPLVFGRVCTYEHTRRRSCCACVFEGGTRDDHRAARHRRIDAAGLRRQRRAAAAGLLRPAVGRTEAPSAGRAFEKVPNACKMSLQAARNRSFERAPT